MCGIIAVLPRRPTREGPRARDIVDRLDQSLVRLRAAAGDLVASTLDLDGLAAVAAELEDLDRLLRGAPGVACLLAGVTGPDAPGCDGPAPAPEAVATRAAALETILAGVESALDAGDLPWSPDELEAVNAVLVRLKDACWAIGRDRPAAAAAIADLIGGGGEVAEPSPAMLDAFWAVQVALSALDRLEVRGRDSAGLHLLVTGHGLDLGSHEIASLLGARMADNLFTSLAVRTPLGQLSFVYKAAAEIGELGDNTRALVTVLGHTRWASVGLVSQPNAHPLTGEEAGPTSINGAAPPYAVAAINGDVDNYADLSSAEALRLPPEITTDSKVIPTLLSRRLAEGCQVDDAFRTTVARSEGSVAIGVSAAGTPDQLHLALRGSGQSLYIGLAADAFIVASEAYGLVQETTRYLRMDGEGNGNGRTPGQVVILDRANAGSVDGIRRLSYDGTTLPVEDHEVRTAEITTRDIDRGGFPHFLLKEITEAPRSFRKTLRGKIVTDPRTGMLSVRLGAEALPPAVTERLAAQAVSRIYVVGQGTAAVAGQSAAAAIAASLGSLPITVAPVLATELSGFALADDMSDTLVIAVSQSGTTTDTNRTVDLVRARGAHIVSVVNRRNSDLVEKSHGVLYTSDGRDVEMSVASTKAFYAQVAAGFLLALALADQLGCGDRHRADRLLRSLRLLPDAMEEVLGQREVIADAAIRQAPSRRHWAVVGNGPNRIAAAEIRIKLSELCYHAIACDGTEDKKHIDLSSEPMILVCAAGLTGPNADDVAKEVAIYRAHRAAPIVVASRGEADRFKVALHTIEVPVVDPELAFVLSAMAGHLFGYEAALSIDAQARPLREARAAVEAAVATTFGDGVLLALRSPLEGASSRFFAGLRSGAYNGHLEAATAVRVASLFRYATGVLPVEGYELEYGKVGTPDAILVDLVDALTAATGELTRPVDAIKHQAKTVTVGISRSEDALLRVPLVAEALATGAAMDCLSYRALRTLAALDPAVAGVEGFTRYRIDGDIAASATIEVVDRGGISLGLASRTERDPRLLGTKHHVAEEREVTVACGGRDGRTLILVPETKANNVTGMTLLHVRFHDQLAPQVARLVLSGYRNRYAALADAVTETESGFDDARLGTVPLVALLTEPVYVLAERWKRS